MPDHFSLDNYKIESAVVDLHTYSKKTIDGYVHGLIEAALPGAFIIYKDHEKHTKIAVKNSDGSQTHQALDLKNFHNFSDLNLELKFPVASHAGLNWYKNYG